MDRFCAGGQHDIGNNNHAPGHRRPPRGRRGYGLVVFAAILLLVAGFFNITARRSDLSGWACGVPELGHRS